jgi:hypothetical protein
MKHQQSSKLNADSSTNPIYQKATASVVESDDIIMHEEGKESHDSKIPLVRK